MSWIVKVLFFALTLAVIVTDNGQSTESAVTDSTADGSAPRTAENTTRENSLQALIIEFVVTSTATHQFGEKGSSDIQDSTEASTENTRSKEPDLVAQSGSTSNPDQLKPGSDSTSNPDQLKPGSDSTSNPDQLKPGSDSTSITDHSTSQSDQGENEYNSTSHPDQLQPLSDSTSPVPLSTDAGASPYTPSSSPSPVEDAAGCTVVQVRTGADYHMNVTEVLNNTALTEWTPCKVNIVVPKGNVIHAFFEDISIAPSSLCNIQVSLCYAYGCQQKKVFSDSLRTCCRDYYRFYDSNVSMTIQPFYCSVFNIQFLFRAVPNELYNALPVVNMSSSSAYTATPGFDDNKNYPLMMRGYFELNITQEQIIMVSFPHFDLENHTSCRYDYLELYTVNESVVSLVETWCGLRDTPILIFNTSIKLKFVSDSVVQSTGFKMMYTVLPKNQAPELINDDLFNCSVPHFEEFAHHLNCNLAVNCVGKEDEINCDYTSEDCGPGLVDAGDKCYTYSRLTRGLSWYDAYSHCLTKNQSLVSPSNPQEWKKFLDTLQYGKKVSTIYTGLRTAQSSAAAVPNLYQSMWQWSNKTLGLYIHLDVQRNSLPSCTKFVPQFSTQRMQTVSCVQSRDARYVCETRKSWVGSSSSSVVMPALAQNFTWSENVSVVICPSGHVVRDFLLCDLQSHCQEDRYATPCVGQGPMPLFQCDHSSQSIHYTLVCDFRLDCSDGSDERWCVTDQCPEASCRSGQCISNGDMCDGMQQCVDNSDENCPQILRRSPDPVDPPALVTFNGKGQYSLKSMKEDDPCPQTHFKCRDSYCLPLYLRCNGVEDCPGHEDETGCETYTCPGFFRCRSSMVCLHPENVCDGIPHCPQRDDEQLCHLTCPEACHCEGLAFVCSREFAASLFPALRYLDVSGSKMTLSDITLNFYLVHLRMSMCDLEKAVSISLQNLRILDLSHNWLTSLNLDFMLSFPILSVLILTGNPLVTIVPAEASTFHENFQYLSLSQTRLASINGSVFKNFPAMKELNLSTEWLTTITEGFASTPRLEVLDLRGSYDLTYPSDMLKDLKVLRLLYANDFKLCCKTALPESFDQEGCFAPSDDIASCEDLLRSDVYRVFLWMFALLAVVGNVGSFFARFYLQDKSYQSRGQSSFNVFVANLSVADFLMGIYLTIIGVADYIYRGQYVWYVETWKKSVACQTAGFLSFASSEVSAFFICLITLDRFLILRFPFGKLRFRQKSALVASIIAWILGFALAAVPFLPMSPPWEFYSQTGICIPLPFTDKDRFKGYTYSFSVMMVLNLVLFVLIAVGQAFIFSTVRASTMVPAKKKASRDSAIARRLTTIVLSDFLCWFPVGLLGVLASTGVRISVDIRVGVAIFVLPFNSALNPFLYTFNIIMEKRSKAVEARMLERLESRHFTELSRMEGRLPNQMIVTKETALNQIEGWMGMRVITMSDLAGRFDMMPRMNDTSYSHPE